MALSEPMHDIKLWRSACAGQHMVGGPYHSDLPICAAQEHRLHKAEYAALQYAKRDAVPPLAGTDAFSERAYASAYDKRAANVRFACVVDYLPLCMCRHSCQSRAAEGMQQRVTCTVQVSSGLRDRSTPAPASCPCV